MTRWFCAQTSLEIEWTTKNHARTIYSQCLKFTKYLNFRAKTSVELFLRAKIQKLYYRHLNFRAKNDIVSNSNQNIWIFISKTYWYFWRENSKMLLSYLFPATKNFAFLNKKKIHFLTLVAIFQIETHTLDAFSESSERQLSLKMCSATTTAPLAFVD